jgi:hypothetical protein
MKEEGMLILDDDPENYDGKHWLELAGTEIS